MLMALCLGVCGLCGRIDQQCHAHSGREVQALGIHESVQENFTGFSHLTNKQFSLLNSLRGSISLGTNVCCASIESSVSLVSHTW